MTYHDTVNYLYSLLPVYHRVGKAAYKASLDNALELDAYFGHPHKRFRTVHVAGTNGKGSVAHMTASVLQAAGYRTGLYTSPHLKDFRERIKIDGGMIAEEEVISFVRSHDELIRRMKPSFFEMTVAMAFDYFARMEVDVAVIEVGMGGRLDSTNIITPEASVITNIGHDHMEFLGETLAAVAGEKAGIIKTGVPVIIGETQHETADVFRERAESLNAPLAFADRLYRCRLGKLHEGSGGRGSAIADLSDDTVVAAGRGSAIADLSDDTVVAAGSGNKVADHRNGTVITAGRGNKVADHRNGTVITAGRGYRVTDLRDGTVMRGTTPLGGLAQQKNIQTVAAVVDILSGPFGLKPEHFLRGVADVVASTGLMGRWQVLSRMPLVVCDTGHNREGLEYVVRQIKAIPKKSLHMVVGFVNDKDLSSVLPLFPRDATYYFTRASVPRALNEELLRNEAGKYGLSGDNYPSVAEALRAARAAAGPDDMIFIGGSTFVVADAL